MLKVGKFSRKELTNWLPSTKLPALKTYTQEHYKELVLMSLEVCVCVCEGERVCVCVCVCVYVCM